MPSGANEVIKEKEPGNIVMQLALDKAQEVGSKVSDDAVIIGADTIVTIDGSILGKPKSREDAFNMIKKLSGRCHSVYTGVALISGSKRHCFYEETKVYVSNLSDEEIRAYVATGDCMDKAGAYGIQGIFAKFICKIEGDYNNVVGLPVARLYNELKNF